MRSDSCLVLMTSHANRRAWGEGWDGTKSPRGRNTTHLLSRPLSPESGSVEGFKEPADEKASMQAGWNGVKKVSSR